MKAGGAGGKKLALNAEHKECSCGTLADMEVCRQLSEASAGVAVAVPLQREQTLSLQLVESKRQWHYWQSHAATRRFAAKARLMS